MLCRITQSSDAHRTESVSVMDHEQTMGVNSRVLNQKQPRVTEHPGARIQSTFSQFVGLRCVYGDCA